MSCPAFTPAPVVNVTGMVFDALTAVYVPLRPVAADVVAARRTFELR